jgi:hypothetical protein
MTEMTAPVSLEDAPDSPVMTYRKCVLTPPMPKVAGCTEGTGAVCADAVSVMLLHRGGREIEIAGATNEVAEQADRLQLETGEGPCLDAARDNTDSAAIEDSTPISGGRCGAREWPTTWASAVC